MPLVAVLTSGALGQRRGLKHELKTGFRETKIGKIGQKIRTPSLKMLYRPVLSHPCVTESQTSLRWYLSIGLPAGEEASFDEESIFRGTVL